MRCINCWETSHKHISYSHCKYTYHIGSTWEGIWFPDPIGIYDIGHLDQFYVGMDYGRSPWFYREAMGSSRKRLV